METYFAEGEERPPSNQIEMEDTRLLDVPDIFIKEGASVEFLCSEAEERLIRRMVPTVALARGLRPREMIKAEWDRTRDVD